MSEERLLAAAAATVGWIIVGLVLFGTTTLASTFELAVSGPFFDLSSLLDAWLLTGAILGVTDVLILWDMLFGW